MDGIRSAGVVLYDEVRGRFGSVEELTGEWGHCCGNAMSDEPIDRTAQREVFEELGLRVETSDLRVLMIELTTGGSGMHGFFLFIARVDSAQALEKEPSAESRGGAFLTLDELRKRRVRRLEHVVYAELVEGGWRGVPLDVGRNFVAMTPFGLEDGRVQFVFGPRSTLSTVRSDVLEGVRGRSRVQ